MTISQHFTLAGVSVEDAGKYLNIADKVLLPKTATIVEARKLAVDFNVPFIDKLPEAVIAQSEPIEELIAEVTEAPRRGRKPKVVASESSKG
jgi:hypothetical protein